VREFKQIAGRAGRKGYDDHGTVVCQAPEHVIENRALDAKAEKSGKKVVRKKPPEQGYVHWDEGIFRQLIERPPEPLVSHFGVGHGMLLSLLRARGEETHGGYGALVGLIADCHERPVIKQRLKRDSKELFKSLRKAAVVEVWPRMGRPGCDVKVSDQLQREFSLHHTLSLYLVETLALIEPERPTYALDVLSVVEAILEQPKAVLYAQERKVKDELFAKLKAEGVEYEERMAELDKATYPKPNAEFIYGTFNAYVAKHPWLKEDNIRPKSIARDMYESYASFGEYVKRYGLASAEGVLLRYLSETYKTLVQSVPASFYTDELTDIASYLRATLARVDSTLVEEWEGMLASPEPQGEGAERAYDVVHDPKALRALLRADLHLIVKALAERDYEEASRCVAQGPGDDPWTPERLEHALQPYYAQHERIVFDHTARLADKTFLEELSPRVFRVRQVLVDPESNLDWYLAGEVDLRERTKVESPLVRVTEIAG
jgi:hypothetical protein